MSLNDNQEPWTPAYMEGVIEHAMEEANKVRGL